MKPNVIICKNPRNDVFSNLLSKPAEYYPSAQFYMDFSGFKSIPDIIEHLDWMESRGYHLVNDRGWVYRSIDVSEVVQWLANNFEYSTDNYIRMVTRSGNLRDTVVKLLEDPYGLLESHNGEKK